MISRTSLREEVGRVVGVEVSDEFAYPLLDVFPQERTIAEGLHLFNHGPYTQPGMSCVNFFGYIKRFASGFDAFQKRDQLLV